MFDRIYPAVCPSYYYIASCAYWHNSSVLYVTCAIKRQQRWVKNNETCYQIGDCVVKRYHIQSVDGVRLIRAVSPWLINQWLPKLVPSTFAVLSQRDKEGPWHSMADSITT